MINFQPPSSHIHILVRALIDRGQEIILCQVKGKTWYFLPGGHVEDGESALTALAREMNEELGLTTYPQPEFVGICEHQFEDKPGTWQHEINIVFRVSVNPQFSANTKEAHIEFVGVQKSDLSQLDIRPGQLKTGLLEWLNDDCSFYKPLQKK